MDFRIADTFTDALARLPAAEQKAVKTSAFDLQLDPTAPGLSMHRIDASRDPNFWSVRVNRDIRIIVHKTQASLLLAYVDHHDKAYSWAQRRRIEAHPRTGAVQIVELRAFVEDAQPKLFGRLPEPEDAAPEPLMFSTLSGDDLLSVGVPEDWIATVQTATESGFFDLAPHLPAEAAEALLSYAAEGVLKRPQPVALAADPFAHPDAQRRFRTVENLDELRAALDAPWERWAVFLHPSQRAFVDRDYDGPARVAGSAGTGKTVVALHRAVRLLRANPRARVLLTTFSQPLADALRRKVELLTGPDSSLVPRLTVAPFESIAIELHEAAFGEKPRLATEAQVRAALAKAGEGSGFSDRFLFAEWSFVFDAWQVEDAAAYAAVPRLGRKNRLGAKQRERLAAIFLAARRSLQRQHLMSTADVFGAVARHYTALPSKPFDHVVVDEAQDISVPELRFLAGIVGPEPNALFFAGDLGQRIFQQPFSWKGLGIDVRGRSATLKVNYRTSHQIRQLADRLIPPVVRDVDNREEERKGTISIFDGPVPEVAIFADPNAEREHVAAFLRAAINNDVAPAEIGIFVRSRAQLPRAHAAAEAAGLPWADFTDRSAASFGKVGTGIMHLAKGLEFKAVAVIACDADVLPLKERIDAVVDEADLDEVFETERQLLYVACTRARDRLMVTAGHQPSDYLKDL